MTESAQQPEPTPTPVSGKLSVTDIIMRASLTQLTLAVLVVVFVWQWLDAHQQIAAMRSQLAEKIAEMDGTAKANQKVLEQTQETVREEQRRLATMEAAYAETQSQRAALEALYNDLSISRDETALAEVEQMLLIAGQQLQLSANVKAALIAMQSADARLQRMDRPAFNGLRKAIAQDMDKLRALPSVDMIGLGIQLDNLFASVNELPLVYQAHAKANTASAPVPLNDSTWQRLLREIWQEARQLVRIENIGKAEMPLLSPSQEFFLRENLKLKLSSARLALLAHDEGNYSRELKAAEQWMTRYFDVKSAAGAQMQSGLRALSATSIRIELPDVSGSLQAVRNYRLSQEKGAR
ncbi:MAG: uroporphyrinogen-III C-methyltransferase [Gallionella sp.]|nr:uroporphyrinogen-III C-methyltransferase [Gallionella sp.]